ncbi:MAG: glycerol kinase, partial [Clostridiales bacterium]|nr:glycerol kinase [Clostridiales bacterium]
ITRGTGRAHIVRAALESIALQSYDVISAMQRDSGISLEQLRVDGGASKNGFLMQFQSDILGIPVRRPKVVETTALGAAMFAGLAVGYWNENELKDVWQEGGSFNPNADPETVKKTVEKWHKAVQRSLAWEE